MEKITIGKVKAGDRIKRNWRGKPDGEYMNIDRVESFRGAVWHQLYSASGGLLLAGGSATKVWVEVDPDMTIRVTAEPVTVLNRFSYRPMCNKTDYTCTGPDGTQFQNYVKSELVSILRRKYPLYAIEFSRG